MRNRLDIQDMEEVQLDFPETGPDRADRLLGELGFVYGQQDLHRSSEALTCRRTGGNIVGRGVYKSAIAQPGFPDSVPPGVRDDWQTEGHDERKRQCESLHRVLLHLNAGLAFRSDTL